MQRGQWLAQGHPAGQGVVSASLSCCSWAQPKGPPAAPGPCLTGPCWPGVRPRRACPGERPGMLMGRPPLLPREARRQESTGSGAAQLFPLPSPLFTRCRAPSSAGGPRSSSVGRHGNSGLPDGLVPLSVPWLWCDSTEPLSPTLSRTPSFPGGGKPRSGAALFPGAPVGSGLGQEKVLSPQLL